MALIAFSIISIFSIGLTSIPAYAQFTNFTSNFVHISWNDFDFQSKGDQNPLTFEFDQNSVFPLYTTGGFTSSLACTGAFLCTFEVVNFVDQLDNKIIFIDITFATGTGAQPATPVVTCFDATSSPGILIDSGQDGPDLFIFDFECHPNPNWESIVIQLDPNVILVEIWTETFPTSVGGTFIPIDTTALLLAGVQGISMWMIPVVAAGVAIGVFVIKRRK